MYTIVLQVRRRCDNEISVFADVFDSYFWELYNDGTKWVQVRIYAQAL